MSQTAFEHSKEVRRRCQACQARKARFRQPGAVKADRDHTLCFECFRSERDRRRAGMLAAVQSANAASRSIHAWLPVAAPRTLTAREVEHRQRMLAHLRSVGHG